MNRRPSSFSSSVIALAVTAPLWIGAAHAAPVSNEGRVPHTVACADLQTRLDDVMTPLARRVGDAAALDVTLHVEQGRVASVDAVGGVPAYRRGVQRALTNLRCGAGESGTRQLKVLVVDPRGRLPVEAGRPG